MTTGLHEASADRLVHDRAQILMLRPTQFRLCYRKPISSLRPVTGQAVTMLAFTVQSEGAQSIIRE